MTKRTIYEFLKKLFRIPDAPQREPKTDMFAEEIELRIDECLKGHTCYDNLPIPRPFNGISLAYPVGADDVFVRHWVSTVAREGWSVLLLDGWSNCHVDRLKDLFDGLVRDNYLPPSASFRAVNFRAAKHSCRVNPLQPAHVRSLDDAVRMSASFLDIASRSFRCEESVAPYRTQIENLLAAAIFFFVRYDRQPYDEEGRRLTAVPAEGNPADGDHVPERYTDSSGTEKVPRRWTGRYSTLAHVISFFMEDFLNVYDVLMTDSEVAPLLSGIRPLVTCKEIDQYNRIAGTLRSVLVRFMSPHMFWVLSGDDVDLGLTDAGRPTWLVLNQDSAELDSCESAMASFILDCAVQAVSLHTPVDRPCTVVLTDPPAAVFPRIPSWIARGAYTRMSFVVGEPAATDLDRTAKDRLVRFLFENCDTVVTSNATSRASAACLAGCRSVRTRRADSACAFGGVTSRRDGRPNPFRVVLPHLHQYDCSYGWLWNHTAHEFNRESGVFMPREQYDLFHRIRHEVSVLVGDILGFEPVFMSVPDEFRLKEFDRQEGRAGESWHGSRDREGDEGIVACDLASLLERPEGRESPFMGLADPAPGQDRDEASGALSRTEGDTVSGTGRGR